MTGMTEMTKITWKSRPKSPEWPNDWNNRMRCYVAQMVMHQLVVWQARVWFPARHPFGDPSSEQHQWRYWSGPQWFICYHDWNDRKKRYGQNDQMTGWPDDGNDWNYWNYWNDWDYEDHRNDMNYGMLAEFGTST